MSTPGRPILRPLLHLLLSLSFRKLAVLGAGRIPAQGPLLIVGAAKDAVLDPLLVLWASPRPIRCLARPSRFERKMEATLLEFFGFAPGISLSSPDGPIALISRCEHALVSGEALALFLDAGEDGAPAPAEVRIAAEALLGARVRGVHPVMVSVKWAGGPQFPKRGRGRLFFSFPLRWEEAGQPHPQIAALEAQVAGSVGGDGADLAWCQELELLEKAEPLAREATIGQEPRPDPEGASKGGFEERCRWAWLEFPVKFRSLVREAGSYFGLLEALGISMEEASREEIRVPDRTYFKLLFGIGGLPAALYGWAFHVLPFTCATWLAEEWAEERKGSYGVSLLWTSLSMLPVFYGLQAWALWHLLGGWRSLIFTAAAIPAGLWALAYAQLAEGTWRTASALIKYRLTGRLNRTARERRAKLLSALSPLLWIYRD